MKTKVLAPLLIIVLIIVGGLYFSQRQAGRPELPVEKPITEGLTPTLSIPPAVFTCAEGKSITAEFSQELVKLKLSDGRNLELPQAISASGGRYANQDESIVFWNKGDTAFVEEDGQTTFADCQTL